MKGPPDLRVQMQLGREYIFRTDYVTDTAIAPFGSSEANCAVIAREEYGERVQFVVEDVDVGKTEVVGTTSFVGIPVDAIRSGSWQVLGFDAVVEIELTLQPMEKASDRAPLAEELAPPSVDDGAKAGGSLSRVGHAVIVLVPGRSGGVQALHEVAVFFQDSDSDMMLCAVSGLSPRVMFGRDLFARDLLDQISVRTIPGSDRRSSFRAAQSDP